MLAALVRDGVTARLPGLGVVTFVGVDDLPYQFVPDHVRARQPGEVDVRDTVEDVLYHAQAAHLAFRQVDLGDVAGHHDLRPEPEAGEEHLHLLGRGVLRLVENDERVIQRPTTHKGQRGYFNRARSRELRNRLGVDRVVQGVVEGAQVRVDLLVERAGEEGKAFTRLDGRAGENDPVDLLGLERLHRLGHREVRLAGARRTEREDDRVLVE